jgi:hypothetical protein
MTVGRWVSLAVIGALCGAGGLAQPLSPLYGRIADPSGAAVAGASVTVVDEDAGFRRTSESAEDGGYFVGSLAAGSYKITVRKDGFRTMIRFHVRVNAAGATQADFNLVLGSVLETITVEGAASATGWDRASVVTSIGREELDRIPLDGRGILGLVELAPGTNVVPATRGDAGQFVADGQRPNTNYFAVDGISENHGVSAGGVPAQATGGALPVLSALGSLDSLIPVDAIHDFQIRTSSSEAQFGRLPGASIEIESRSGSSELRGSAAYAYRNELLAANDWYANRAGEPRSALRENNLSGTLGGPLRRNRTYFFAAYEHMDLIQPFAWLEPVPSAGARATAPEWAQPVMALFPLPNGPALGNGLAEWNGRNSRPGGLDAGSIRLDHALTQRVSLFARYSDSPSHNQFGSFQVNDLNFRSWTGTLGMNFHLTPGIVVDFRLNRSATTADSVWSNQSQCELQPVAALFPPVNPSCNLLVRIQIDPLGQLVSGNEGRRLQRQSQAVDSASFRWGAHSLRLGTDFLRIEPERDDAAGALSLIASSLLALDNIQSFWVANASALTQSTRVDEFSAWLHDTWQATKHLTVIGGLRWEYSPPPPTGGALLDFWNPASGTIQSSSRALWLAPYGHFAPRLGLAFSPGKNRKTVLRVGGGLYFDSSLSIATDVINGGPLSVIFNSSRYAPFTSRLSYGFLPMELLRGARL